MKKLPLAILLTLTPILAIAANTDLSFTPPPGDYSVIFLGNLFGRVDGVLFGSGSQIMGQIFSVVNAAVLALGGIVIIYTLLVSTLNTAQEGQFLGQRWSSLWIPVRTTFGLSLLIPKASGYCLMQVFVMWVVLQGIGAADKVWSAALRYLNRGGAIVSIEQNPGERLLQSMQSGLAGGAQTILAGQVCMYGIQKQLEQQRDIYLKQKHNHTGPCYGKPSNFMKNLCDNPVPDFITSVNIAERQSANPLGKSNSITMPMNTVSPYDAINGICGEIKWNSMRNDLNLQQLLSVPNLNQSDYDTMLMTRGLALQQMYNELSAVARRMVDNNPHIGQDTQQSQERNFSWVARQPFGVPLRANGTNACPTSATKDCFLWGIPTAQAAGFNTNNPPLLQGRELQGALAAYDAIMRPTLVLSLQAAESNSTRATRRFINQAERQGWIMAGSYFFNLIQLNVAANRTAGAVGENQQISDANTGINGSTLDIKTMTSAFRSGSSCIPGGNNGSTVLCQWFGNNQSKIQPIVELIQGGSNIPEVYKPDLAPGKRRNLIRGQESSTVFGYTNNSTLLRLPNQPGIERLQFADEITINPTVERFRLQRMRFSCDRARPFFAMCLGRLVASAFYNSIIVPLYNLFLSLFMPIINELFWAFVLLPLQGMADVFQRGVEIVSAPGTDPFVALAQMGTYYINFAGQMWLNILGLSVASSIIPVIGPIVFVFISLGMPLIIAWVSVMASIGLVTAYYIPLLPYMIFTFGAIGWMMAVIEAMVAAPIVALGITHPEGHESFGKGEPALMILMNIFLRPTMMIIGYIAAIALAYVGVWLLNAGYDQAVSFMRGEFDLGIRFDASEGIDVNVQIQDTPPEISQPPTQQQTIRPGFSAEHGFSLGHMGGTNSTSTDIQDQLLNNSSRLDNPRNLQITGMRDGLLRGGYVGWAAVFSFFLSIVAYITMYMIIVQKSFGLIATLPDKVLRWIGGQPESVGQDTMQWAQEAKQEITDKAGEKSMGAVGAIGKQAKGYAEQAGAKAKEGAQALASGGQSPEIGGGGGGPGPSPEGEE